MARFIRHYQVTRAARPQDPEALRRHDDAVSELILSIDGLQPETGHETLAVVRELTQMRVWFAAPLLSARQVAGTTNMVRVAPRREA